MNGLADFQSDARECLQMAQRAQSQEERAILVDLAQAWVLLGEQVNNWHLENSSELRESERLS
jgi:hypothetical protein